MPFGLKNAGATYQRCIQNWFKEQIGRNVHAYVDDVVIKSQKADSLIADLTETFTNLRRSEEHTSELQSHYSISYAVFCLRSSTQKALSNNKMLQRA